MNSRKNPSRSDPFLPFHEGREVRAWNLLGCHAEDGGHVFHVWAPHAVEVSLIGDFNGWDESADPMTDLGNGIWEGRISGLERYATYKYAVRTADGRTLAKADPYAFHAETRPGNASKVYDLSGYEWGDQNWLNWRRKHPVYHSPLNIYEVHLGSWRRTGEGEFLSYRDIARYLVPYVLHENLLPDRTA